MDPIKILIINPNTTQSMTDSLLAPIESLNYNNTIYTLHTAPIGPTSINSPTDALLSAELTLPALLPLLGANSAFLVACYSPHPLISLLRSLTRKPVLGIFEASISTALALLREERGEKFGIVSTGDGWKTVLADAVVELLGAERAGRVFAGVETVGMNAGDLHGGEGVERRVNGATGKLLGVDGEGKVGVVVLGCAGMVGMEQWVREVGGKELRVVDGVRAGVGVLQGLVRGDF